MEIQSQLQFNQLSFDCVIINFYANWAPQSVQMTQLCNTLSKKYQTKFVHIEAETFPEITLTYSVTSVPTVVLIKVLFCLFRTIKLLSALKDLILPNFILF